MGEPMKAAGEYPPYLAVPFTSTMELAYELIEGFREGDLSSGSTAALE
jgi:hypothetical protein